MPNYRRVFAEGYSYFLTLVTYRRNPILIENIELLRHSFAYSKNKFDYTIDAIVVLPEHIHMVITPGNAQEYPKIVQNIKYYFSKHCDSRYYEHLIQSTSRNNERYKPIWQKRYYEHTIRNEKDFKIYFDYVHYNPVKHHLVTRAKDWEFSSFGRYVEQGYYEIDWGDFDESIDFE